jgi:SAM-dependent methyltransferase
MQTPEYDTMHSVEDSHWWYAVLRGLVGDALTGRLPPRGRVLDAGCGTGGMLEFLRREINGLELAGIDAAEQAVRRCHQRDLHTVQTASVEALPFAEEAFDAVLSLDVLYHADVMEAQALAEMRRVLRTGGLLVVNLPAFARLRGSHDVAVAGARRYDADEVRSLLGRACFAVETLHYWNAWSFVPLLVWRQLSRLKIGFGAAAASDLQITPAWMNPLLAGMGRMDAVLCRELRIPFGSSVFAVARKMPLQPGGRQHGIN